MELVDRVEVRKAFQMDADIKSLVHAILHMLKFQ